VRLYLSCDGRSVLGERRRYCPSLRRQALVATLHPMMERQRTYAARDLVYSVGPRRAPGRAARHAMLKVARRAVKRLATQPRTKLHSLSSARRDEWREMRSPVATHEDQWFMRVLGCFVFWGEFAA